MTPYKKRFYHKHLEAALKMLAQARREADRDAEDALGAMSAAGDDSKEIRRCKRAYEAAVLVGQAATLARHYTGELVSTMDLWPEYRVTSIQREEA